MEKQYMTLNHEEWEYLAEGNQHIILKFNENIASSSSFIGKILKIEKEYLTIDNNSSLGSIDQINEILNKLVNNKIYNVHSDLMQYLPFEEKLLVENKSAFLQKISDKIEKDRPESRKSKKIDINSDIIVSENLSHVYSNSKGFVVEIKPKSPLKEIISQKEFDDVFNKLKLSNADNDKIFSDLKEEIQTLRYFKMLIVKQENGDNKNNDSKFNPRDLFSEDPIRTKQSINDLLSNPSNNLKIHFNNSKFANEILSNGISSIIIQNKNIFEKIVFFQKGFEKDIESIKALASQLDEKKLLDRITSEDFEHLYSEDKFKDILDFLISLTWKDLSLMINFVLDEGNEAFNNFLLKQNYTQIKNEVFCGFYKIGLIDVKLKDIRKLKDFYKSQTKINEIYVSHLIKEYFAKKDFEK